MKVVSLFSGIGGLDLGLEQAGHEVILQVENDPHCLQVLQRHFPGREIRRDVAELTELPAETELLAAGFPCEDVSIMNPNRPGLQGSRTSLCSHIFRLLRKNRAPWVLLENVPGLQMWHLTVDPPQEPAIAHIVHELESLGYSWAHRIISLSAFGLPQRRHRVFIVATLHGDPRDVLLSTESICKGQCINLSKAESKEKSPAECYECFMTPPHVTPTISVTCVDLAEKRYGPVAHEICTLTASNGRRLCMVEDLGDGRGHAFRLEIEDAERLNGFPVGWTETCFPLMIPGRPWMKAVDSHRSCIKRIELLGRAVAIPQARWIGQRLMSPYEIKFSRESDGINFSEPVPGLSSITREDSGTEAKLRAWPLAAWNILSSPENIQLCSKYDQAASLWRSRRGLKRMSDTPEIFSFIPLGEFLSSQRRNIDAEKLLDFKVRAEKSNIELMPFISAAFGMQPRGKRKGKQSEQVKTKLDTERAGGECAGELVWISTKVSKRECFWPGIALHLDRDRDVIPSYAIEKIKPNQSSSLHRMVVYFAEESYEWLRSDRMLPFREHFDEFERQPLLVSRAKYQRAVELALEWQMHQDRSVEKLYDVHLREARAKEVEKLHQKIGNLSDTPNISCGICIICQSRKNDLDVTPSSKSSNLRASTRQRRTSPLKGVQAGQSCPQLRILAAARKGLVSAQLSLLREQAVGRRVEIYWHADKKFYPATITAFDDQHYSHRIEHDDGDIEPAAKLWEMRVNLLVDNSGV